MLKNGEGDLVVMSLDAYEMREEVLDIRQKLLDAEAMRLSGCKSYSVEEMSERLKELINRIF